MVMTARVQLGWVDPDELAGDDEDEDEDEDKEAQA
jgi:transcription termination/antitermination protein NusA